MMKLLSCRFNMDTNRVEARFEDGTTLAIDCIAVEDEYGNTPAQRAELDWLLYNKPLEYAQMVLRGEIEHYLSLGCDHGRLEDWAAENARQIDNRAARVSQRKFSADHTKSAYFQRKSRKVSVNSAQIKLSA